MSPLDWANRRLAASTRALCCGRVEGGGQADGSQQGSAGTPAPPSPPPSGADRIMSAPLLSGSRLSVGLPDSGPHPWASQAEAAAAPVPARPLPHSSGPVLHPSHFH